ncbi:MAG TPA: hypothetical protein VMR89_04305 [Actinomycetota bacterium]|nr:hypothetical protein [Actinomycetota bacterium]
MSGRGHTLAATGILLTGILLGSLMTGIAAGHFEPSVRHLIKHAEKVFFTKKAADRRFVAVQRLAPGVTITGALGGQVSDPGQWEQVVSFPAKSRKSLADEDINFPTSESKAIIAEQSEECTGTAAQPTAPPGMVCIYASSSPPNTMGLDGEILPGASHRGFVVRAIGDAGGLMGVFGTWAYTEPRRG